MNMLEYIELRDKVGICMTSTCRHRSMYPKTIFTKNIEQCMDTLFPKKYKNKSTKQHSMKKCLYSTCKNN